MAVPRWQLLPGQRLTHRSWQDEHVLFNDLSGDTHLLGNDALDLLLDLNDGPLDASEFADDAATGELLGHLASIGLIALLPC